MPFFTQLNELSRCLHNNRDVSKWLVYHKHFTPLFLQNHNEHFFCVNLNAFFLTLEHHRHDTIFQLDKHYTKMKRKEKKNWKRKQFFLWRHWKHNSIAEDHGKRENFVYCYCFFNILFSFYFLHYLYNHDICKPFKTYAH